MNLITTIGTCTLAFLAVTSHARTPRCIGISDPESCEKLAAEMAAETAEQKASRIKRLNDSQKMAAKTVNAAPTPKEVEKSRLTTGVSIGMTSEEAISSSWGKPKSVNRTTNVYGTSEQWVYGGNNYLYFNNGKLTSIQN